MPKASFSIHVVNVETERRLEHRQKTLCKGQLTSKGVSGIYSYGEVYFWINTLPYKQATVRNINRLNEK